MSNLPKEQRRTYGTSRAVRLEAFDYSQDVPIHLTICAESNVFNDAALAKAVCDAVEGYCSKLAYRLYGYCLMPDHLHVLLSPADSGLAVDIWLQQFKSLTTNRYMKMGHTSPLWQASAHDHVCRMAEVAENVVRYIANNPVRRGLVEDWQQWPWTKVFVDV
jgi:REP element-mobilizing transposase RayT